MSSSPHRLSVRQEPRSWGESEDLDLVIDELRGQIERLRARVEDYRNVVEGETNAAPRPAPEA